MGATEPANGNGILMPDAENQLVTVSKPSATPQLQSASHHTRERRRPCKLIPRFLKPKPVPSVPPYAAQQHFWGASPYANVPHFWGQAQFNGGHINFASYPPLYPPTYDHANAASTAPPVDKKKEKEDNSASAPTPVLPAPAPASEAISDEKAKELIPATVIAEKTCVACGEKDQLREIKDVGSLCFTCIHHDIGANLQKLEKMTSK